MEFNWGEKMKIAYLLSHVPGPRFYKKMKKAKEEFELFVIYRNRESENFQTFFHDKIIKKHEIMNNQHKIWKTPMNLYYIYFKNAVKKLKQINPDIIHCGNLDMLTVAVVYKRKFNNNTKIVYEIGDLNKRTYNNSKAFKKIILKKILIRLEKNMFRDIEKLVISSEHFWDDYYRFFISKKHVLLYPNMPERDIFNKVKKNKNNVKIIGFIGRVRYFNQLRMLIDTVHEINKNNDRLAFKILVAGVGPESKRLSKYANKYNFIDVYGSYNYDEEIAEIYSKVDMVYSVYDANNKNVQAAIPNRLYEAVVSEKPIIVAKNTKLSEFVLKNHIGFAVNSNYSRDLLQLLTSIYEGNIRLESIEAQCHKIKDKYYLDEYNNKLMNMYKSLINFDELKSSLKQVSKN